MAVIITQNDKKDLTLIEVKVYGDLAIMSYDYPIKILTTLIR